MKKTYIQLACAALVLALLTVALILLREEPAAEISAADAEPAVYVIGDESSPLPESVDVELNLSGSRYSLSFVKNADGNLTIPGWENLSLDAALLSSVGEKAARLPAKRLVAEAASAEDLAAFGLNTPRAIIKTASGAVLLGADAPGGEGVYAMQEGAAAVYLVAPADSEPFFKAPAAFVDTNVTPPPDAEFAGFDSVTISGENYPQKIVVRRPPDAGAEPVYGTPTHELEAPVNASVDAVASSEKLNPVFGLTAREVVDIGEGPDFLAQYGLEKPAAAISVATSTPELTFELRASAPDSQGMCYLMKAGSPVIYKVTTEQIPWLSVSAFDLMAKHVILSNIADVSTLRIIVSDMIYEFSLEGEGNNLTVTYGRPPDGDVLDVDNFKQFYQTVVSARYDEEATLEDTAHFPTPLGLPALQFEFNYRDGRPSDRVEFFKTGLPRRYLVSLNGEQGSLNEGRFGFLCSEQYVNRVIEDVHKVYLGENVKAY